MTLFLAYVMITVTACYVLCESDQKYTTKYDNMDVEEIIANDRLLRNYVDCMLEKGHCTPEGIELKKNMPDAIQTECSKCSEKQKEIAEKLIHYLIDNKPMYWEPLKAMYDTSGAYTTKYLESVQKDNESSTVQISATKR